MPRHMYGCLGAHVVCLCTRHNRINLMAYKPIAGNKATWASHQLLRALGHGWLGLTRCWQSPTCSAFARAPPAPWQCETPCCSAQHLAVRALVRTFGGSSTSTQTQTGQWACPEISNTPSTHALVCESRQPVAYLQIFLGDALAFLTLQLKLRSDATIHCI